MPQRAAHGFGDAVTEDCADDAQPVVLPEQVRARIVALAAEALGRMPEESLPASLKRVASFAPNRRAKLAAGQIAIAIANDEEFRSKLAVQVRAGHPELAAAVESGATPISAGPAEVAAFAYLLRPEGWLSMVDAASQITSAEHASAVEERSSEQVERLQRQLDAAVQDFKALQRRRRQEISELKTENAALRRKLGDARARLESAEAAVDEARAKVEAAGRLAASASDASEAEVRRLRARIEELERSLTDRRRAERTARDVESMRARLLLDTLLESVQGLRRELALPASDTTPADQVEAVIGAPDVDSSSDHSALAALDDPGRLDQLLGLPRAHLIVDGYNVTMTAWRDASLEQQRDRLLGGLAPLAARTAAEVTVVFDAADKQRRPSVNRPRGLRVLFSPVGVIADDVIRELVAAEPYGRPVVVVTDDQAVARDVTRSGARAARGTALITLLGRG
jgi:predicted RNA-binding protein with PIN domain